MNGQSGSSYTAQFWQYDSRLGRRWNTDPVVKVHESSYATFANNPMWFVDPLGSDTVEFVKNVSMHKQPPSGLDRPQSEWVTTVSNEINVTPSAGDDVFINTTNVTMVNEDGSATTKSHSVQWAPTPDTYPRLTSTGYFFGMFNASDNGITTLAKQAPSELLSLLRYKAQSDGFSIVANYYAQAQVRQRDLGVYTSLNTLQELGIGGFASGVFLKWSTHSIVRGYWRSRYAQAATMKDLRPLGVPPIPSGYAKSSQWGDNVLRWGKGLDAPRARIGNVTAADLKGMTKNMAGQWAEYYNAVKRVTPNNKTAIGRADLMDHIYNDWEAIMMGQ